MVSQSESLVKCLAKEVIENFHSRGGSEQIAQEEALIQIGRIFEEVKPSSVLDLGAGIGTISFFLSRLAGQREVLFFLYESNQFCQDQLLSNLEGMNFDLIRTELELEKLEVAIDLLVIDDFIGEALTQKLLAKVRPKAIFIEGHRRRQRKFVYKALRVANRDFRFYSFRPTKISSKVGCVFRIDKGKSNVIWAYISISGSLAYSRIKLLQARLPLLRNFSLRKFLGQ